MNKIFDIEYVHKDGNLDEVVEFINHHYEKTYNTIPPIAETYAVVKQSGMILACMGLEDADLDGSFQIERTYSIVRDRLPFAVSKDNCIQLSRWTSIDRRAGLIAVYAAVTYAVRIGREFGFVEHTDTIHEHSKRNLGVEFWDVEHSPVVLDALPAHHREFYAKSTMKPYLVQTLQMRNSLAKKASEFELRGL